MCSIYFALASLNLIVHAQRHITHAWNSPERQTGPKGLRNSAIITRSTCRDARVCRDDRRKHFATDCRVARLKAEKKLSQVNFRTGEEDKKTTHPSSTRRRVTARCERRVIYRSVFCKIHPAVARSRKNVIADLSVGIINLINAREGLVIAVLSLVDSRGRSAFPRNRLLTRSLAYPQTVDLMTHPVRRVDTFGGMDVSNLVPARPLSINAQGLSEGGTGGVARALASSHRRFVFGKDAGRAV